MELWLTLVALQAWACAVRLPNGSAVFGAPWHRNDRTRVRGLHWLSPWPSALGITAMRMPLHVSHEGHAIVAHGDLSRGGTPVATDDRTLDCDAEPGRDPAGLFEERGASLHAHGRPFVSCPTRAHTRVWHFVAQSLVAAPAHERAGLWQQHVARSLDVAHLGGRLEEARTKTRWLGWTCNALCVLLFIGVPAIGLVWGSESALALAWPALASLAAIALWLAARAHRSLFPERRGERFVQLLTAALYPPALLRFRAVTLEAFTAGAHPLAWSRLLDAPDRARAEWAREIAWLERSARAEPERAVWLNVIRDVIREAWPSPVEAPELRFARDPEAESYCPACLEDFRRGFDHCPACDTPTTLYTQRAEA